MITTVKIIMIITIFTHTLNYRITNTQQFSDLPDLK